MKHFVFALFLALLPLAISEYPRIKYRGPAPYYPKPPPYQQSIKKWQQQPPRPPPSRARPPIRSPIPVRMPPHHKVQMGAASINRPVAVPVRNFWKNTQTTFRSAPVEHFVTSAPVLPKKTFQSSPAVRAQEYDFQIQSNNVLSNIQTIKQIGEKGPIHTIPAPNLSLADRPAVVETAQMVETGTQKIHHHPEIATYVQIQKAHQYQVTESPELTKQTAFKTYYETHTLPNDLYQYHLINPSTITLPLLPNYLQQQQNYVEPPEQFAMDKSIQEEPRRNPSSMVATNYNLEPDVAESIVQSQYVQNYFDTRDNGHGNVVADVKSSNKNGTLEGYYVTLPNKEAVEALASLQAAGQLNSSLQKGKNEVPVSIYVPEEGEESREDDEEFYDDYAQEDLITEEMRRGGDEAFGHRVKSN